MMRMLFAIELLEGFDNGRLVSSRCGIYADGVTPTGNLLRHTEWSRYKPIYLLDHAILTSCNLSPIWRILFAKAGVA